MLSFPVNNSHNHRYSIEIAHKSFATQLWINYRIIKRLEGGRSKEVEVKEEEEEEKKEKKEEESENGSGVIEFSTGESGAGVWKAPRESVGVRCRRSDAIAIRGIERLMSYWRPFELDGSVYTPSHDENRDERAESALSA